MFCWKQKTLFSILSALKPRQRLKEVSPIHLNAAWKGFCLEYFEWSMASSDAMLVDKLANIVINMLIELVYARFF